MDSRQTRRDAGWDRELRRGMERQVILGYLAPRHQAAAEWQEATRLRRAAVATRCGEPGVVRRLLAGGRAWLGGCRRAAVGHRVAVEPASRSGIAARGRP
jgi:hypothetical protein